MTNQIGPYSFQTVENDIFAYWRQNSTYPQAKAKNKGGKKWYFLDGPHYTSGKIHIGTAWNKSLKDTVLRYKRMNGFNVLYPMGFDSFGLPAETAAKKEGIHPKKYAEASTESKEPLPKK